MHAAFELYSRVLNPTGRFEAPADWEALLDDIPRELIAGIKLPLLYRHAPSWAKPALAMMLPDSHPERVEPPWRSAEETAEVRRKRGIARELTRGHEGAAVELLSRVDAKDEKTRLPGLFERFRGSAVRANAGAFFVKKSDGSLRIIVDAREGNSCMSAEGHVFQLFSVEALINVISNLKLEGQWWAVSTDWRHFFHQIGPLPDSLKPYFVINVPGVGLFVPRATPMGWILAPLVGQTVTWAALLSYGNPGDEESGPGVDSGLDGDTLRRLKACPAWLPLRGGGGIFVILDNVLVVTKDQKIAAYWKRRIVAQARLFNIVIKVPKNATEPVEIVRMTPTEGSFDFLGVVWRHGSRHIKLEAGQEMPGLRLSEWAGTHRHLAAVLGMLLWYHRVHGAKLYGEDMLALRRLYARATPPSGSTWETAVALSGGELATLQLHWAERAAAVPAVSRPLPASTPPMFAAVDASDRGIGIVELNLATRGATTVAELVPEALVPGPIALKELHGIIRGCQVLRELATAAGRHCNLFIIATDSMNAKSWVDKQYAGNYAANPMLQRLFEEVLGPETRLYLTYVPTGLNVADGPSRGVSSPLEATRRAGTLEYLGCASREAKGIWSLDGGQVGAS